MNDLITLFKDYPVVLAVFGFMACIIAAFFYWLFKKDVENLETKIDSL